MKLKSNAKFNTPVESGTVYEIRENNLIVTIHRINGLEGWFLTCNKLDIVERELKSKDLFACVRESRKIIKDALKKLSEDVKLFCIDDPIEITRY